MSKNIVLLSMVALLSVACGGEVTSDTGETTGGAGGSVGGGAQAGSAGQPGGGQGGTAQAGTSAAGTSAAGTSAAGTGQSGTAGTSSGGQAGSSQAGAGGAGGCTTDNDCPQFDNGTQGYCVNGKCEYVPLDPCMGKKCGDYCSDCPPGQACPPVVQQCNAKGACTTEAPVCGDDPPVACKADKDCPVDDGCILCNDGTDACPTATCEKGVCVDHAPLCPVECKDASQCPQPKGPCKICPNDQESCPTATCTAGQCGVEYLPACGDVSSPCDPVKVTGAGNCKKPELLGYYWDGDSCEGLVACECAGDCGKLTKTAKECVSAHMGCTTTATGCTAQQAVGVGMCKKLIGYIWNGSTCNTTVVGCTCEGKDCDSVYPTTASCEKDHAACPANPCAGKKCGEVCSTCPAGQVCPAIVEHCDIDGACKVGSLACD